MSALRGRRQLVFDAILVLAAGGLATGLRLAGGKTGGSSGGPAEKRPPAPEVEGEVLVPPPVRLAGLRGKPVFVNFGASWRVACRREAPDRAGRIARSLTGAQPVAALRHALAEAD